ncbi:acylphosphatase [Frigoribacterium sp. 2-23]|uniref:acylphosphatase n=1 Tax=Frigoribacterium sp. 2-23 TaxID=3415006 RepID=UPI003C6F6AAC
MADDTTGDVIRRRAIVHGRVQGVGFRFSTEGEADRLGAAGFVRNRADGTVEVEVEGAPSVVDEMLAWLREGPLGAEVTSVEISDEPPVGEAEFRTVH